MYSIIIFKKNTLFTFYWTHRKRRPFGFYVWMLASSLKYDETLHGRF